MSFNDPIAELLTKIRNAKAAQHVYVDVIPSKLKQQILTIMKDQGFISNFLVDEKRRKMRIFLKYSQTRKPLIQGLKRESSPGLRRYLGYQEIPRILGGLGIAILSTPKGVLEGEAARKMKVGGEILCSIW